MTNHENIPSHILDTLLGELPDAVAYRVHRGGHTDGEALHPGDSFGTVAAWLWRSGQHGALMLLVAGLATTLRTIHGRDRRIAFDDVVAGLGMAASASLQHDEIDDMLAAVRAQAPQQTGQDLHAP